MFPVVGAPTSARNNATVVPAAPRCFPSRVVSRSDKGVSWPLQFGIDQMNKYWPQAGCADASRPASSASHAMFATSAFMTSPAATQSPFDLPASPGPSRASAQRPKTRDDELCQGSDGQETVSDNAQSTEPTVDITTDGGRRRRRRRREGVAALWHKWNPALTLENSGSVARDHLAVERTFLAYVRTSLAIASTGVGACVLLLSVRALAHSELSLSWWRCSACTAVHYREHVEREATEVHSSPGRDDYHHRPVHARHWRCAVLYHPVAAPEGAVPCCPHGRGRHCTRAMCHHHCRLRYIGRESLTHHSGPYHHFLYLDSDVWPCVLNHHGFEGGVSIF